MREREGKTEREWERKKVIQTGQKEREYEQKIARGKVKESEECRKFHQN